MSYKSDLRAGALLQNGAEEIRTQLFRDVKGKLSELLGNEADDVLVEYTLVMVANNKSVAEIVQALCDLIDKTNASHFGEWLSTTLESFMAEQKQNENDMEMAEVDQRTDGTKAETMSECDTETSSAVPSAVKNADAAEDSEMSEGDVGKPTASHTVSKRHSKSLDHEESNKLTKTQQQQQQQPNGDVRFSAVFRSIAGQSRRSAAARGRVPTDRYKWQRDRAAQGGEAPNRNRSLQGRKRSAEGDESLSGDEGGRAGEEAEGLSRRRGGDSIKSLLGPPVNKEQAILEANDALREKGLAVKVSERASREELLREAEDRRSGDGRDRRRGRRDPRSLATSRREVASGRGRKRRAPTGQSRDDDAQLLSSLDEESDLRELLTLKKQKRERKERASFSRPPSSRRAGGRDSAEDPSISERALAARSPAYTIGAIGGRGRERYSSRGRGSVSSGPGRGLGTSGAALATQQNGSNAPSDPSLSVGPLKSFRSFSNKKWTRPELEASSPDSAAAPAAPSTAESSGALLSASVTGPMRGGITSFGRGRGRGARGRGRGRGRTNVAFGNKKWVRQEAEKDAEVISKLSEAIPKTPPQDTPADEGGAATDPMEA